MTPPRTFSAGPSPPDGRQPSKPASARSERRRAIIETFERLDRAVASGTITERERDYYIEKTYGGLSKERLLEAIDGASDRASDRASDGLSEKASRKTSQKANDSGGPTGRSRRASPALAILILALVMGLGTIAFFQTGTLTGLIV